MGRCRSFDYKPLMSMSIPESEAAQDIELMNRIQQVQKDYLPIYIVGNICLGMSKLFVSCRDRGADGNTSQPHGLPRGSERNTTSAKFCAPSPSSHNSTPCSSYSAPAGIVTSVNAII